VIHDTASRVANEIRDMVRARPTLPFVAITGWFERAHPKLAKTATTKELLELCPATAFGRGWPA
jgi:hypothetical protein